MGLKSDLARRKSGRPKRPPRGGTKLLRFPANVRSSNEPRSSFAIPKPLARRRLWRVSLSSRFRLGDTYTRRIGSMLPPGVVEVPPDDLLNSPFDPDGVPLAGTLWWALPDRGTVTPRLFRPMGTAFILLVFVAFLIAAYRGKRNTHAIRYYLYYNTVGTAIPIKVEQSTPAT